MQNISFFEEKARHVRREIFEKYAALQTGHPGSTLSMADLAVALYYGDFVRRDPKDPSKMYDRLIVSKGHATACLYPILVEFGVISKAEWDKWGKEPSLLRVFGNTKIPGIDATSGSLGHGLGIGAGYALSYKRRKTDQRVFVVISEGELYEGSIWESLLFVKHYNLDNLHIVIDRNSLIILGGTEECLALDPIKAKIESFGFETHECNGHDYNEVLGALDKMVGSGKMTCLLANTVKGKGVKLMENKAHWHYWNPLNEAELAACRADLR